MHFSKRLLSGICFLLLFVTQAKALINNGDFEIASAQNDFPDRWKIIRLGGCKYVETTDAEGKSTRCLEFTQDGSKATRIESAPVLYAGRRYRLSADIKTENFKGGGGVYVTPPRWNWGESIHIPAGTNDWKSYNLEFVLNEKQEILYRLILFARENSSGKVWFDNIKLEALTPETMGQNAFISAGRMSEAPTLDGDFNEKAWETTMTASPFVKIGFYDYSNFAHEESSVRVGYDEKFLYFAFECKQRCLEPLRNALDDFRNDVTKHDGEMWKQDCVLILLKTGAADNFFEIMVNGAGTVTDALCIGPDYWSSGRNINWESDARTAVKIDDGVWRAEIAIPLEKINLQPNAGTEFQACLGRLNISGNERSSYFPMREGYHTPKFFGKIKLAEELPNLSDVKLGDYKSGANEFSFSASSNKNENVFLNIISMDEAAKELEFKQQFQLSSENQNLLMQYSCEGKELSFMRFSFGNSDKVFWQSPQYSRINDSQQIKLFVKERIDNAVFLNEQALTSSSSQEGTELQATCEPGLFSLKGLESFYALSANDFTIPLRKADKNSKILVMASKFWPENDNEFYIAENSLQPFHVILHNPFSDLQNNNYCFNLAMPTEFSLTGVSGAMQQYKDLSIKTLPDILHKGKKFRHLQILVPGGLEYKPYYTNADGATLMIKLPVSNQIFEQRNSEFYAWAEYNNGEIVEAPQIIKVGILPPLKEMTPKHFMTQMWGGRIVNLNDRDLIRSFVKETLVKTGFNNLQNGTDLVQGTDMTTFAVLNLQTTWGKEADEFLEKYPDLTLIDYLGDPIALGAYSRVCSSVLLENAEMQKIMFETIQKRFDLYDHINFDFERPVTAGPLSCYCPRCLNHFKQESKIPENTVLDYKIIQAEYQDLWTRFMNRKLAALTIILQKITHRLGKQLTFYSGYESQKTLVQYGVDWNLIAEGIDYALCGYRTSTEIIRNTLTAIKDKPLITGVIASPWHFTSREESKQIDKAFTIKGIVLGSKGFLCYNLPQLDGRSYYAMSETAAILTRFEDILYFGKINNQWLTKVEGLSEDQYALFERPGYKRRVLLIYNEELTKAAPFKISLNKAGLKVYDAANDQLVPVNNLSFSGTVKAEDFNVYYIEE